MTENKKKLYESITKGKLSQRMESKILERMEGGKIEESITSERVEERKIPENVMEIQTMANQQRCKKIREGVGKPNIGKPTTKM